MPCGVILNWSRLTSKLSIEPSFDFNPRCNPERGSHRLWLSARALVLAAGPKTFGYPRQAP